MLTDLDPRGGGLQAPHDPSKLFAILKIYPGYRGIILVGNSKREYIRYISVNITFRFISFQTEITNIQTQQT